MKSYQRDQVDIIRKFRPNDFITHNGYFKNIDYYSMGRDLDIFAFDNYPCFNETPQYQVGAKLTMARGFRDRLMIMEQQTGPGGQAYLLRTPRPGEMSLWAFQAIAHGADGMLHFRWRTARKGAEEYWSGVLEHDDVPRARYQEFKKEGADIRRIGKEILGSRVVSDIAVVKDFDDEWVFDYQFFTSEVNINAEFDGLFQAASEAKHNIDFIGRQADFNRYKIIFGPHLILMDPDLALKMRKFVEQGGTFIMSAHSAVKDRDNGMTAHVKPILVNDLFGVEVTDFQCYQPPSRKRNAIRFEDGVPVPVNVFADLLKTTKAAPLAVWDQDYMKGSPGRNRKPLRQGARGLLRFILQPGSGAPPDSPLCRAIRPQASDGRNARAGRGDAAHKGQQQLLLRAQSRQRDRCGQARPRLLRPSRKHSGAGDHQSEALRIQGPQEAAMKAVPFLAGLVLLAGAADAQVDLLARLKPADLDRFQRKEASVFLDKSLTITFRYTAGETEVRIPVAQVGWPTDWSQYQAIDYTFLATSVETVSIGFSEAGQTKVFITEPLPGIRIYGVIPFDAFIQSKTMTPLQPLGYQGLAGAPLYVRARRGDRVPHAATQRPGAVHALQLHSALRRPRRRHHRPEAVDRPLRAVDSRELAGQGAFRRAVAQPVGRRPVESAELPFCPLGGIGRAHVRATGFFRVEKVTDVDVRRSARPPVLLHRHGSGRYKKGALPPT